MVALFLGIVADTDRVVLSRQDGTKLVISLENNVDLSGWEDLSDSTDLSSLERIDNKTIIVDSDQVKNLPGNAKIVDRLNVEEYLDLKLSKDPIPDRKVIIFQDSISKTQRDSFLTSIEAEKISDITQLQSVVVANNETIEPSALIDEVVDDYYVAATGFTPNDPYYTQQWSMSAMKVEEARSNIASQNNSLRIAVIDSGVCLDHPELSGKLDPGWDFIDNDPIPQDEFGHGCGVTGVIAAEINNNVGIAGIAPEAQILPYRVLDKNGLGSLSHVAAAIVMAIDDGAKIINLSLGGYQNTSLLSAAVAYAKEQGVTLVAASGNTGSYNVLYPAKHSDVIAVGSVQNQQNASGAYLSSSFSSIGQEIDIWAPGEKILTLNADNGYSFMSGTSLATPNVAGILALDVLMGFESIIDGKVISSGDSKRAEVEVSVQKDNSGIVDFISNKTDENNYEEEDYQLWQKYLNRPHPTVETIQNYFIQAASEYNVPVELLQAIGQKETNWTQVGPSIDRGWGIMHLVDNEYVNTLGEAADLIGVQVEILKDDPQNNIRGAAALLRKYGEESGSDLSTLEGWYEAAKRLSALPDNKLQILQVEEYYRIIKEGIISTTLWNEKVNIQSVPSVNLEQEVQLHAQSTISAQDKSVDYYRARAHWAPDCLYYETRNHDIDTWVNHWVGIGTYAGAIATLSRCTREASAHFVIRASDGEITQMVKVENGAWHAGAYGAPWNNRRSIGIEHEATITHPEYWYSTPMLSNSAHMARFFHDLHAIPKVYGSPGYIGHRDMPNTATSCPGNLPWTTWANYLGEPYDLNGLSLYAGYQPKQIVLSNRLYQIARASDGESYIRQSADGSWSSWQTAVSKGFVTLPDDIFEIIVGDRRYEIKTTPSQQEFIRQKGTSYWSTIEDGEYGY